VSAHGGITGSNTAPAMPDDIVLTNYFSVRDGQIVSLVIVFNQPADY
jgi:hypothetical protein